MCEEPKLGRGEWLEQAGDEEDEIGSRHEAPREILLHTLQGVRARRVHDLEVAQHVQWVVEERPVVANGFGRLDIAEAEDGDLARGGQIAHVEHFVAKQGVDERALAAVVLADDHEQEELVHLVHELCETIDVRAGAFDLEERITCAEHEPALERDELGLLAGEDLFHDWPGNGGIPVPARCLRPGARGRSTA